eukprot:Lithocolla_globosa_v1_NODE_552_length_3760_cov_9.338462.p5 type:complete len:108 gc:universal NODE_552_length_3760_cov_9.338462:1316-1639(+)
MASASSFKLILWSNSPSSVLSTVLRKFEINSSCSGLGVVSSCRELEKCWLMCFDLWSGGMIQPLLSTSIIGIFLPSSSPTFPHLAFLCRLITCLSLSCATSSLSCAF